MITESHLINLLYKCDNKDKQEKISTALKKNKIRNKWEYDILVVKVKDTKKTVSVLNKLKE